MLPTVLVMILSHVLSDSPDSWQRVMSLIANGLWGLWGIAWTAILLKVTSSERGPVVRWPALSLTVLAAFSGTVFALVEVPWLADSSIELKGFAVSVQLATSYAGFTAIGVLCTWGVVWYVRKLLREKAVSGSDVNSDHTV
jgi:hypothetical protein